MMYFPWIDVETIQGDTAHIAAMSVVVVNDDTVRGVREIYLAGVDAVVKTKLPAAEVFTRLSDAIGAAREAEIQAVEATWAQSQSHAVPVRNTKSTLSVEEFRTRLGGYGLLGDAGNNDGGGI